MPDKCLKGKTFFREFDFISNLECDVQFLNFLLDDSYVRKFLNKDQFISFLLFLLSYQRFNTKFF